MTHSTILLSKLRQLLSTKNIKTTVNYDNCDAIFDDGVLMQGVRDAYVDLGEFELDFCQSFSVADDADKTVSFVPNDSEYPVLRLSETGETVKVLDDRVSDLLPMEDQEVFMAVGDLYPDNLMAEDNLDRLSELCGVTVFTDPDEVESMTSVTYPLAKPETEPEAYYVAVDGGQDLKFKGWQLASVSNQFDGADFGADRWTVYILYMTIGGKLIAASEGRSKWANERTFYKAEVCETVEDVYKFFKFGQLAKRLYKDAGLDAAKTID